MADNLKPEITREQVEKARRIVLEAARFAYLQDEDKEVRCVWRGDTQEVRDAIEIIRACTITPPAQESARQREYDDAVAFLMCEHTCRCNDCQRLLATIRNTKVRVIE
jgi:hypothetical protein